MSTAAIISMAVILTVIWGGFIGAIWYAFRCEKRKRAAIQTPSSAD